MGRSSSWELFTSNVSNHRLDKIFLFPQRFDLEGSGRHFLKSALNFVFFPKFWTKIKTEPKVCYWECSKMLLQFIPVHHWTYLSNNWTCLLSLPSILSTNFTFINKPVPSAPLLTSVLKCICTIKHDSSSWTHLPLTVWSLFSHLALPVFSCSVLDQVLLIQRRVLNLRVSHAGLATEDFQHSSAGRSAFLLVASRFDGNIKNTSRLCLVILSGPACFDSGCTSSDLTCVFVIVTGFYSKVGIRLCQKSWSIFHI